MPWLRKPSQEVQIAPFSGWDKLALTACTIGNRVLADALGAWVQEKRNWTGLKALADEFHGEKLRLVGLHSDTLHFLTFSEAYIVMSAAAEHAYRVAAEVPKAIDPMQQFGLGYEVLVLNHAADSIRAQLTVEFPLDAAATPPNQG